MKKAGKQAHPKLTERLEVQCFLREPKIVHQTTSKQKSLKSEPRVRLKNLKSQLKAQSGFL